MDIKQLEKIANDRHELHKNQSSSRPLSENYELVGLVGEWQFSKEFGLLMDLELRIAGDNRIDFITPIGTIDVKTARKAYNLLRERSKKHADILVLAQYFDDTKSAKLLGWEYDKVMVTCPVRDFGYGIINFYKQTEYLRPMEELRKLLDQ